MGCGNVVMCFLSILSFFSSFFCLYVDCYILTILKQPSVTGWALFSRALYPRVAVLLLIRHFNQHSWLHSVTFFF